MLTIKNTITKMNNTFNGLISRLDMAKEAISEFKDMSEKFPKLKCKQKKEKRISIQYFFSNRSTATLAFFCLSCALCLP